MTPFDTIATIYDDEFENNIVTQHLRSLLWKKMLKYFPHGSHILELNSGTGTDAIFLAENGMKITALDQSEMMLTVAKGKAMRKNLSDHISFRQIPSELISTLPPTKFDGVLSNFGGLNCIRDLSPVIQSVSSLLAPGAYFFACLLNKACLWEMLSFAARGKFSSSMRRFHSEGINVRIGDTTVRTWYYTPAQFIKLLEPSFEIISVFGLNIFSPNPNSKSFISKHPSLTTKLLAVDDSLFATFPFHSLGDHFVVIAKKSF